MKAEWKPGASPGREGLATVSWGPRATSSEEGGLEVEQPSRRVTAQVLITQPVLVQETSGLGLGLGWARTGRAPLGKQLSGHRCFYIRPQIIPIH